MISYVLLCIELYTENTDAGLVRACIFLDHFMHECNLYKAIIKMYKVSDKS